jgi:hypothetical protein
MVVVSKDGTQIGTVKEVRTNDFLVDRPFAFDIYIPFNAVDVTGNTVRVQVNYDQIDHQGWDKPV